VDHPVRSDRSAPQALEIFEGTVMYIGSCGGKDYDLGLEEKTLQPLENPFGPKV
jgi:hypothetical protein